MTPGSLESSAPEVMDGSAGMTRAPRLDSTQPDAVKTASRRACPLSAARRQPGQSVEKVGHLSAGRNPITSGATGTRLRGLRSVLAHALTDGRRGPAGEAGERLRFGLPPRGHSLPDEELGHRLEDGKLGSEQRAQEGTTGGAGLRATGGVGHPSWRHECTREPSGFMERLRRGSPGFRPRAGPAEARPQGLTRGCACAPLSPWLAGHMMSRALAREVDR